MQAEEEVIIFPKYGHSYEVQGGPDRDQLLTALKDPGVTVTFTFIDKVGHALVTNDVEVRVNSASPVDTDRTVFAVGGSVITEKGFDTRTTIRDYNTVTKHGTQGGIFL